LKEVTGNIYVHCEVTYDISMNIKEHHVIDELFPATSNIVWR